MKKILIAVMAVVMVIAMIGSAFAYFTDVRTTNDNTFTAGTLTMQIKDNNEDYQAGPITASYSKGNLAPGQTFTTDPITLKNNGSLDINRIYARFSTTGSVDFAQKFKLINYKEWSSNPAWVADADELPADGQGFYTENFDNDIVNCNAYLAFWQGRGAAVNPVQGYITLADLIAARNAGSGGGVTSLLLFDATPNPFVPPLTANGGLVQVKFTFQLMPETNNTFQGQSCSFRVDFIGSQNTAYPDPSLNTYITQPLGP